jgi:MFS family permease
MDSSSTSGASPEVRQKTARIIFFTLFLELAGFSVIFPLFPAILDYYLPLAGGEGNSLLERWIGLLISLNPLDEPNPWMTAVLFGGTLASLYGILQFIMSPILGRLSDKYGRRRLLLFTLSGTAISYLIWFLSGSFLLLVISRLIGGAMAGNIAVASAAMADITPRAKRSQGMALIGVAFGVGFIFGPLLGGFAAQFNLLDAFPGLAAWGINPFSVAALVSLGLTIINLFWVYRCFPETLTMAEPEERAGEAIKRWGRGDTPAIDRANLTYFLFILAFSGLEFTITFFAVERFAFTPWQNGLLFLYIGFLLIVVQGGIVRRLGPRLGELLMARLGLAFAVASLLLMATAQTVPAMLFALAFLGLGIGLVTPSLSAVVSRYARNERQGYNLGLFRALSSLGRAIGPILAGIAYFTLGATIAYAAGALIMLIPLILAFTLPKPE